MYSMRACFLAVLALGSFCVSASAQAETWSFAVKPDSALLTLPEGYYHCGVSPAVQTVQLTGLTQPRQVIEVAKDSACTDKKSVELDLFLNLSARTTLDNRFIDAQDAGGSLQLVFKDLPGSALQSGIMATLLQNTVLSAKAQGLPFQGGSWAERNGFIIYNLQLLQPNQVLPPELEFEFGAVQAPEAPNVYGDDGRLLTRLQLKLGFQRWIFRQETLKAESYIQGAGWVTEKPIKVEIKMPPSIQAVLNSTGPVQDSAKKSTLALVRRDLKSDNLSLEFKTSIARNKEAASGIKFKLPIQDKRIHTNLDTAVREIEVTVLPDDCTYSAQQLTPLYRGFQDGKLYLQIRGNRGQGNGECMKGSSLELLRVHEKGGIKLGERVRHPQGAPEDMVEVTVLAVPQEAATGSKQELTLHHADNTAVSLEDGDSVELTVSEAPSITGPTRISYGKEVAPAASLSQEGDKVDVSGFQGVAVDRPNWLFFEAADIQDWRVRVTSHHVRPCDAWTNNKQFVSIQQDGFCVRPTRESSEPLRLEFEYRPPCKDLNLPESLKASDEATCSVALGHLHLTTAHPSSSLRRAFNLEERVRVFCRHAPGGFEAFVSDIVPQLKADHVVATTFSGTRAVPFQDTDDCEVRISLRRNGILPQSGAGVQRSMEDEAREVLQDWGRQDIQVQARLPRKKDTDQDVELFTKLVPLKQARLEGFELQEGEVVIPLKLDLSRGTNLKDYDIIEVQVSHANPKSYVSSGESFPDRKMSVRLRVMPQYLAGRIRRGVGPRAFLTILGPTSLVRIPNSGRGATTSSGYRLAESVIFGVGGLFAAEFYDFDRAAPPIPLNPQLHLGLLASTTPQAGLAPPRLSLLMGTGLRLLGGEQKQEGTDSGLNTVVWLEWADRGRHKWEPALLVGLSVNIGSFPN